MRSFSSDGVTTLTEIKNQLKHKNLVLRCDYMYNQRTYEQTVDTSELIEALREKTQDFLIKNDCKSGL